MSSSSVVVVPGSSSEVGLDSSPTMVRRLETCASSRASMSERTWSRCTRNVTLPTMARPTVATARMAPRIRTRAEMGRLDRVTTRLSPRPAVDHYATRSTGVRHRQQVELLVELFERDLAALDVSEVDDRLAHRDALRDRVLRDLRGRLVADDLVERR